MPTRANSEDFVFSAASRNSRKCGPNSVTVNNVERMKKTFIVRVADRKTLHEPVLGSFNQVIYLQRNGSLANGVLVDSAKSKTGQNFLNSCGGGKCFAS